MARPWAPSEGGLFKGLKKRVKTLLGHQEDLEARLSEHVHERLPLTLEEPELYFQLNPLTAALEEARAAARAQRLHEASEHLLEHFHDRIRPLFFLHFTECDMLRPALAERREEANRLLSEVERSLHHTFGPLGVEEQSFQGAIDWFSDFKGGSWMYGSQEDLEEQLAGTTPEAAIQVTWEFNRHGHFVDMGRAYWLTGHERFASEFIVQMVDWSERNPPLFGVNWMDPETVAHRTLNWLLAMHYFLKSAQLTADVLGRVLRTLLLHGLALSRSLHGQPRLCTASALQVLALTLPELVLSKKWLRQSSAALPICLQNELGPDGLHKSGSSAAQRQACEWLLLPAALHRLNQMHTGDVLAARAQEALEALCHLRPPNALVPEIGRGQGPGLLGRCCGPSEHTQRLLAFGALALGHGALARLAGEMPMEMLWWFGPSAQSRYDSLSDTALPPVGGYYPEAGLVTVRDGWESRSSWCLLRGLPLEAPSESRFPPPLAHDDLLSLALTLEGEPVLVEPGGPAAPGSVAQAFATLYCHSAPRVAGELEPLQLSGEGHRLAVEQRREGLYMAGGRDVWMDSKRAFRLRRELLFQPDKKRLAVRDSLEGEGDVQFEEVLLLAPHIDVMMRGDMGCLLRGRRLQARIHPVFPARFRYEMHKGRTQPFAGWVWSENGRPVATQRLRYYCRVTLPAVVYLWFGWEPGDPAVPRAEELERLFSR